MLFACRNASGKSRAPMTIMRAYALVLPYGYYPYPFWKNPARRGRKSSTPDAIFRYENQQKKGNDYLLRVLL